MGWDVLCETAIEYGKGCASQGWVLTVYGDHAQLVGAFPREAQDEVWDDPRTLTSTCFAPQGRMTPKNGGYVVSGKWSFSSGIDHADWLLAGAMLAEGDKKPRQVFFAAPKSAATVIDDWFVAGLAGTGSKSFTMDEVFVPSHRILDYQESVEGTGPGALVNPAPLYRYPRRGTGSALASVPIGAAMGMLDDFAALCRDKARRGRRAASEAMTALRIAEAAAELDCARFLVVDSSRQMMEVVGRGEKPSVERRLTNRRNSAYAAQLAVRAVDRIFASAGGGSIYLSSRLQRAFRDVHAGAAHVSIAWDLVAAPYGYLRLGHDPA
jgi:alkylation response protein AidB-like acyl-CoA dehydrogenase